MKDQGSIDIHESQDVKWNRGLDIFIESVHSCWFCRSSRDDSERERRSQYVMSIPKKQLT